MTGISVKRSTQATNLNKTQSKVSLFGNRVFPDVRSGGHFLPKGIYPIPTTVSSWGLKKIYGKYVYTLQWHIKRATVSLGVLEVQNLGGTGYHKTMFSYRYLTLL